MSVASRSDAAPVQAISRDYTVLCQLFNTRTALVYILETSACLLRFSELSMSSAVLFQVAEAARQRVVVANRLFFCAKTPL